ncbi:MAG: RluA family pseudouridine synthase [Gemmatimonadales bacterium]|nr:MAG: RluA family pseudouridine synthase [Gemmatimonadales bacterium]
MTEAPSQGIREVRVPDEVVGSRTDAFLSDALQISRTRLQRLLREGEVELHLPDGTSRAPRKSEPVEPGWRFRVHLPPPEETHLVAEDLPLDVVYQDPDLAVVNKAPGVVVHPAPGHPSGTLVNALLFHLRDLSGVGGRLRPGIVHRLDRDTSGLLVVAKTDRAHLGLAEALRRREVKRIYRAAVWGHLDESPVTVDAPLARDPGNRKRMAVAAGGRRAVTRARVREDWPAAQLLDVSLQTGRTHQIRVHMAHLGHPVVGDPLYGRGGHRGISGRHRRWAEELDRRTPRQFLHAAELAFEHPVGGERMHFRAPLPADLTAVVRWVRETTG